MNPNGSDPFAVSNKIERDKWAAVQGAGDKWRDKPLSAAMVAQGNKNIQQRFGNAIPTFASGSSASTQQFIQDKGLVQQKNGMYGNDPTKVV